MQLTIILVMATAAITVSAEPHRYCHCVDDGLAVNWNVTRAACAAYPMDRLINPYANEGDPDDIYYLKDTSDISMEVTPDYGLCSAQAANRVKEQAPVAFIGGDQFAQACSENTPCGVVTHPQCSESEALWE